MNKQKGFTLIELLVVIAIIGILASVVLAALSSARTKGQSAAVQSTLANMRAQSELYYSTNGNYGTGYTTLTVASNAGGVNITPTTVSSTCDTSYATNGGMFTAPTSTSVGSLDTLIKGACRNGATNIFASVNAAPASVWALRATAPSTNTSYCVDSNGASKAYTTSTVAFISGPLCP